MNRRQARQKVFEKIYEYDFYQEDADSFLKKVLEDEEFTDTEDKYVEDTLRFILKNLDEIDKKIENNLKNWTMKRLSKVSLAILRVAFYELEYNEKVPDSVAINEAVEIAKLYGDEETPSFVNGVLGNVREEK